MKIALLAHAGSVHTRRWGTGLIARGHEVHVYTQTEFPGLPDDIPADLLPGKTSLAYLLNIPRIRRRLRRFAPDIVHAHYATGYGVWGFMQKTAPLVVSVWGSDIVEAMTGRFPVAALVRRALRTARRITASSRFLLEQTAQFEPSVSDRLVYIPFGIDIGHGAKETRPGDDLVRIIFAKQFFPVYAPEMVLRAFASACRRNPGIRLQMIGGGPLGDKLRRAAEILDVSASVEIRDWVEMTEARHLIYRSDIMVMPSRTESFGVAALEATSAGIPVIATRVGGIPEIIEDGRNGILIATDDETALSQAILRLAGDAGLRRRMGEEGKKIAAEKYNFADCLDRMENLYRQVAGN